MRNSCVGFLSLLALGPLLLAQQSPKGTPAKSPSGKAGAGNLSGVWRKLDLTEDQERKLGDILKNRLPGLTIARRELTRLTRQECHLRISRPKKRKVVSVSRRIETKRKEGDKLARDMLEEMKGVLTSAQRSHLVALELSDRLAVSWDNLGLTEVQVRKLALVLDKYTPDIDYSRARHEELVRTYHEIATYFFRTTDVTQLRVYQRQMMIVRNAMEAALEKDEELHETLSTEAEKVLTIDQRQRLTRRREAARLQRHEENEER